MSLRRKAPMTTSRKGDLTILDSIGGDDAIEILRRLAESGGELACAVEAAVTELLTRVDVDQRAAEILADPGLLAVEDLWDRAGPRRDGHADPVDVADEMFEDGSRMVRARETT